MRRLIIMIRGIAIKQICSNHSTMKMIKKDGYCEMITNSVGINVTFIFSLGLLSFTSISM